MAKIKITKELWLVIVVLLVGAFLRLYRINEYMTYLGDEGRDMIIVRRLLTEFHPPLIGPGTSVGNMYLGPLYYYMMALPTLIANFSPVGPAVMVALLGVATIGLVWRVGKEWFGSTTGLIAAGLYAISPTIIIYSQSSWNPNIMPFFALLSIYAIWRVWQKKEFKWLIVAGISYAFVLQSHYFGVLLAPVLFLFWVLSLKKSKALKSFRKQTVYAAILFGLLMSPLLIFDLRHNFQNFSSISKFSSDSGGSFGGPIKGIIDFVPTVSNAVTRILAGRNEIAGVITTVFLLLGLVWLFLKKAIQHIAYSMILVWLGVGILGLAMYKSEVFDHYMGFIYPAFFLLLGGISQNIFDSKRTILKMLMSTSFLFLIVINLQNLPLWNAPNRQLQRSHEIATFIKDQAQGEKFNLASLSENSNRDTYQYFLLIEDAKVVDADPNAVFYTVTDQLFVVCEKPKDECDPVHDPSAWITNFGWSKIEHHWEVSGANIYKLSHSK